MPAPDSLPQRRDSRGRIRVRESDQPSRPAGCRSQCIRAIERREPVELCSGVVRRLDLLGGDGELDEGGKEPCSLHAIASDVGERPRELRQPYAWLSLGEPQERKPGLGLPSGLDRGSKRRRGAA